MELKVNPKTGAWAPYGYIWVWNLVLGDWILTECKTEQSYGVTHRAVWDK